MATVPTPAESKSEALAVLGGGDSEASLVACHALLVLDAILPLSVEERAAVDARLAAPVHSLRHKALRALAVAAA